MKIENIKWTIKNVVRQLNPVPPIGGMEISESAIHFVWIRNGELLTANLRLPPGVIEAGKIKDRANFVSSLKSLRLKTPEFKKNNYVVLILPQNNVYTQVFNIPVLAGEQIEEAAKLNLQMLSPIEIKTAYADWQKVGEAPIDGGQFELLGAFIETRVVEDYISALRESDFKVAAVEFSSLALVRTVASLGENIDLSAPHLILQISAEGVTIIIMRSGSLYFTHFNSWQSLHEEIGKREITLDDFKGILNKELQRIINFYSTHWPGQPDKLILVSESLLAELGVFLESSFKIKVISLALKEYKNIPTSWFPALGAALRGLIPRTSDNFISLMAITVQKEYFQTRILNFTSLWRNIAITTSVFLFMLFVILDGFLLRTEGRMKEQVLTAYPSVTISEIDELKTSANKFNKLVALADKAAKQTTDWTPFLQKISDLAGEKVKIERLSVESTFKKVLVIGLAVNETEVINFKNKLLEEKNFSDVDLRLSEVKIRPDGTADFNVMFNLKTLVF